MASLIFINVDKHIKSAEILKKYFYIFSNGIKLAFSTVALLLNARLIINLRKRCKNLQTNLCKIFLLSSAALP